MPERTCEFCGKPIIATRGNKRFCDSSCRARASMGAVAHIRADTANDAGHETDAVDAMRDELSAAGVDASPDGVVALLLIGIASDARQPASGRVAAAREARAAMVSALARAKTHSPLDEVKRKRDEILQRSRGT